ncbi:MAG: hypothetical protein O2798_07575 [Chloroflexi bacterium]|nr:hypothetical protein [Chloroflexota bacterium]MDA1240688.1 hypothetical protein [Chloroflexota bacterium]
MPLEDVLHINTLLKEHGFERVASQQVARAALIEAGLTNSRKQNIAADKRDRVTAIIEERIARVCGAPACLAALDASGRRVVEVASKSCEVCGGSDNTRALNQMSQDLIAAGRPRLLVVGGSPNAHTQLRQSLAGSGVEVETVPGDRPTGSRHARELVDRADVVVIWANTILDHKVSTAFTGVAPEKTFTCARRSVSALAQEVSRHVTRQR